MLAEAARKLFRREALTLAKVYLTRDEQIILRAILAERGG
jgi:hypothetical protein